MFCGGEGTRYKSNAIETGGCLVRINCVYNVLYYTSRLVPVVCAGDCFIDVDVDIFEERMDIVAR